LREREGSKTRPGNPGDLTKWRMATKQQQKNYFMEIFKLSGIQSIVMNDFYDIVN